MYNRLLSKLLVSGFLILGLFLSSCTTDKTPVSSIDQSYAEYEPTTADMQQVSKSAITLLFNYAASSIDVYGRMQTSSSPVFAKTSSVNDGSYTYENGYHIWQGTLMDPDYPEALTGSYLRKIQYQTTLNGTVLEAPDHADCMFIDFEVLGAFGFVGDSYGVTFDHKITGYMTGMMSSSYHMAAQGKFDRVWRGIYNGRDATLKTKINYRVDDLTFLKENPEQYTISGSLVLSMLPWTAIVTCNGGPTAQVKVFRNNRLQTSYNYDLSSFSPEDLPFFKFIPMD